MKASKQQQREAKRLFQGCRVDGALDENRVRQVVSSLIEQKPRGYIGILNHFHRLVKLDVQSRATTVDSAVPLTDDQKTLVQVSLAQLHGTGLSIEYQEDSGLIGGMRVQVGSNVYDGSVRSRLNNLQDQF